VSVTELGCITTLPIDCDKILEAAKSQLSEVLVIGWTKDGKFYAAASEADLQIAVYLATKFIHKVHSEYEP
jgi:hypothetical protein